MDVEYNLTLVTPPAAEPLVLDEVKHYLRLDGIEDQAEDAYINTLITVSREYCEEYQNRAYITQIWELSLSSFPIEATDSLNDDVTKSVIELPKGNLQKVNKFTYKDASGNITEMMPDTDYILTTRGILGRISPPFGKIFPVCLLYPLDPIVINYTCGYGDDASKVPQRIKHAILLLISHWYENRMVINDLRGVNPEEISFAVTSLLQKDRITVL